MSGKHNHEAFEGHMHDYEVHIKAVAGYALEPSKRKEAERSGAIPETPRVRPD